MAYVKKNADDAFFVWQRETAPAPYSGPVGDIFFGTLLSMMNHIILEGNLTVMRSRLLTNPNMPPDSLQLVGSERQFDRGASETDPEYQSRVLAAHSTWDAAGTDNAIISQLAIFGITATIVNNGDWNWDGNTAAWSRFWVLIETGTWAGSATTYGDGSAWGGGQLWGLTADPAFIDTIRKLCRQWKPAHCYLDSIIIVHDAATWATEQPDGTWGNFANRSQAAAYVEV